MNLVSAKQKDPSWSTSTVLMKIRKYLMYNHEFLENEVYSDLYSFFRRYYQGGDYLSLRRYKEGVYAIPYEGDVVIRGSFPYGEPGLPKWRGK